jgi:hypothetical protein
LEIKKIDIMYIDYAALGYVFKVYDDRNRLVFVTPVRKNATLFVREKLGYTPEREELGILIGNTYRVKKWKSE